VPVIIGALEIFKKGLHQNIWLLPGHPLARELQITRINTAHIICKVLGQIT